MCIITFKWLSEGKKLLPHQKRYEILKFSCTDDYSTRRKKTFAGNSSGKDDVNVDDDEDSEEIEEEEVSDEEEEMNEVAEEDDDDEEEDDDEEDDEDALHRIVNQNGANELKIIEIKKPIKNNKNRNS